MHNIEASMEAAKKLESAAEKLLMLGDATGKVCVKTDKLIISFDSVGLKIGNINSKTATSNDSGYLHVDSVWNLRQPPIDPPDIAQLNRMAGILESYLTSI